jgi:hypothetical protein
MGRTNHSTWNRLGRLIESECDGEAKLHAELEARGLVIATTDRLSEDAFIVTDQVGRRWAAMVVEEDSTVSLVRKDGDGSSTVAGQIFGFVFLHPRRGFMVVPLADLGLDGGTDEMTFNFSRPDGLTFA